MRSDEAELTAAGWQQVAWWFDLGYDRTTAIAKVWAGDDALERWPGHVVIPR